MTKTDAKHIVGALKREYPDAYCSLTSRSGLELLVASRLSAQCTDARVNIVTKELFSKYKTMEDYANADIDELMAIVRPCGFYRVKAQNIKDMCAMLISEYDSNIPDTIEELIRLPGVGRKIANLIMGDLYGKPAIVADTHAIRITNLLGLVSSKDPKKVEEQLKLIIDPKEQSDFCHRLVFHGRAVCIARRPRCGECVLRQWCNYAKEMDKAIYTALPDPAP